MYPTSDADLQLAYDGTEIPPVGEQHGAPMPYPVGVLAPEVDAVPSDVIATGQVQANAVPVQVLTQNRWRRRVTIKCLPGSVGTAYLGSSSSMVTAQQGFPLVANESVTIEAAAEVWLNSNGGLVTVAFLAEYIDGP